MECPQIGILECFADYILECLADFLILKRLINEESTGHLPALYSNKDLIGIPIMSLKNIGTGISSYMKLQIGIYETNVCHECGGLSFPQMQSFHPLNNTSTD